ncbi:MAG: four helix bundle protein [Phycisphaerae bacterium]
MNRVVCGARLDVPENKDIQERTFRFAVRILKLVRSLPFDPAGSAVARQLARSGTGVGANIEEAQGSHSKKEFIRRMNIARSEARETLYWLRLVAETELLARDRLREITNEADELVRILTTIVKRSRNHE